MSESDTDTSSISSLSSAEVQKLIGVPPQELIDERHSLIEDVVPDLEKAPANVKDKAFEALSRSLRTHRFPTYSRDMLEITRSAILHPLLEIVTDELITELELTPCKDVEIKGEMRLSFPQENQKPLTGRIDYVLKEPEQEDSLRTTVSAGKKVLLFVECKKKRALDGFKQSVVYLHHARNQNPDRDIQINLNSLKFHFPLKDIFAIAINLVNWMLIKSPAPSKQPASKFISTEEFPLVFKDMGDKTKEDKMKEKWLKDNSLFMDVLYTILKKELLASKRCKSARLVDQRKRSCSPGPSDSPGPSGSSPPFKKSSSLKRRKSGR